MTRLYPVYTCLLLSILTYACVRDFPATEPYIPPPASPNTPGLPPAQPTPSQKRLFLSNNAVRVGIDLNAGGAITYLAEAGSNVNMVNNNDLGRQIQTSIYGGPYPYSVNGKDPVSQWLYLGWNPVQTGDYYNHPAQIVSYQQSANQIYVKNIPKIWPLFKEPADCQFEHWYELRNNTVKVRCRITINRADTTSYEARTQETPCVYLNGPWYRMVTYEGMQPFTNATVTEYPERDRTMTERYGTENWIALLNEKGRGVGLYRHNEFQFRTSGFGLSRVGGEFDGNSGYINSDSFIQFDYNGQYEFEYSLVVGTLTDIRQFAYAQTRPAAGPNFRFEQDRQGWFFYNSQDAGWPIQNEVNMKWQRQITTKQNLALKSPLVFWRAAEVPRIYVQAAYLTKATTARLAWRLPGDPDIFDTPTRVIDFPIIGDGQYRTYEINLSGRPGWEGVISQIQFTYSPDQIKFENGSRFKLRSVTTTRPNG